MPREEKPGAHSRTRDTTAAPPGRRPEMRHSKQGRRDQDKERADVAGPSPWYSHTLRPYSKPQDRVQDLRVLQLRSRRANIQGPKSLRHTTLDPKRQRQSDKPGTSGVYRYHLR
jgi:hypothetical protein